MQKPTIPVIVLAFANEHTSKGFLSGLSKEMKQILKALEPAVQKGKIHIKILPAATQDEIISVFQDAWYEDRIWIFHYGGHADEDGDSRSSGSRLTGCSHSGSSLAEDDQTALDFGEEETWQKMMQNLGWGKSDRSYCNSSARVDTLILHRCLLRVT